MRDDLKEKLLIDLESKIDLLKQRDKDSEERKTYDEVFDYATLKILTKMISKHIIDTVDFPISTGKEANVFKGTNKNGNIAIKIYRDSTATFRNLSKYILGDPRFKNVKHSHRHLIQAWAKKEFKNLARMNDAKVRAPKPIFVLKNVLVMEYIGDDNSAAPMLKDVKIRKKRDLFNELVEYTSMLYNEANLVHGDLSEYNVLINDNETVIIDVGQAVVREHPMAEEFLIRDINNLVRYFRHLHLKINIEKVIKKIKG